MVDCFYFDQDDATAPCKILTREVCHELKAAGVGKFINHGRTFRLYEKMPQAEPRFFASDSPKSAESISLAEMKANVGITENNSEPDEPPLRHLVKRAQEKIRSVGRNNYTDDIRAPLAPLTARET